MAKYILKMRASDVPRFIIYKAKCPNCECEFLVEDDDIQYKSFTGKYLCKCANLYCNNKNVIVDKNDVLSFKDRDEFEEYLKGLKTELI